ncbi:PadR family transcriptional regulator [Streptomyces triculaminicus]|uniref:PadR family transcriptional regulator n=1 Tax=Streptomyces triculaminicus TaxID=2816232 RepID=UPI0037D42EAC
MKTELGTTIPLSDSEPSLDRLDRPVIPSEGLGQVRQPGFSGRSVHIAIIHSSAEEGDNPSMRTEHRALVLTSNVARILAAFLDDPAAPRYGLDLMRETGLSSGTVYPALIRLERAGWLTAVHEDVDPHAAGRPPRRVFTITEEGIRAARTSLADLALLEPTRAREPSRERAGAGTHRPHRLRPV